VKSVIDEYIEVRVVMALRSGKAPLKLVLLILLMTVSATVMCTRCVRDVGVMCGRRYKVVSLVRLEMLGKIPEKQLLIVLLASLV
jgi:hypothetical protein